MQRTRIVRLALVALLLALAAPAAQALTSPARTVLAPNMAAELAKGGDVPVVIQFATPPTRSDARVLRAAGFTGVLIRYSVVPAVSAVGNAKSIAAIARNPRVTYIEHDAEIPYLLDRSTRVTRSDEVWSSVYSTEADPTPVPGNFTGKGIGIAINDSGVDARHRDLLYKPVADAAGLPAKTTVNKKVLGRSLVTSDGLGSDEFVEAGWLAVDAVNSDTTGGHGTHVAGIAAGNGATNGGKFKGHAPGADIIGLGAGETLAVTFGLASLDWVHANHAAHNIRVVNNSWGGAGEYQPDSAVTKAVQKLVLEDGIVVVFAAGNDGGDGETLQTSTWANIPEAISVANYFDRTGWVDTSSSRGLKSDESTWPDFAAPGTQIISTAATGGPVTYYGSGQDAAIEVLDPHGDAYVVPVQSPVTVESDAAGHDVIVGDYASMTGTSMAAPAVAGMVALVLEANPDLNPAEVKEIFRSTANMPGNASYDSDGFAIGTGVADAAEAVAVALRMKEGLTIAQALGSASLDLTASPTVINAGSGPVTDNTIPLAPQPVPVSGDPHIYQGSAIDPTLGTVPVAVVQGEPLGLSARSIVSNDATVAPLSLGSFTVRHRILQEGVDAFPPMAAEIGTEEDIVTGEPNGQYRSDNEWTVPLDAAPGSYVFVIELTITSTNQTFTVGSLAFTIA